MKAAEPLRGRECIVGWTLTRASRRLQKDRNRRAACPLPQLSGRGILEGAQARRALPSPPMRARDLRKEELALSCKQRARNPWKEAVALSRSPRARRVTEKRSSRRNSIFASWVAKLASRISKIGGSDDFRTFRQGGVSDWRSVRDRPGDGFSPASGGSYRGGARPR